MAVTVKKAVLWRREIENKPGELARTLEPLARAKADLGVVMAYRYPGDETRGAVEVYPVTTKKATAAAGEAGLSAAAIPALLVEGDNKPGLAHALSQAVADAGINLSFFVAQAVGRRFSAVVGFESEEDARKATPLIKKAGAARKK
jgi:hypothetical protein